MHPRTSFFLLGLLQLPLAMCKYANRLALPLSHEQQWTPCQQHIVCYSAAGCLRAAAHPPTSPVHPQLQPAIAFHNLQLQG